MRRCSCPISKIFIIAMHACSSVQGVVAFTTDIECASTLVTESASVHTTAHAVIGPIPPPCNECQRYMASTEWSNSIPWIQFHGMRKLTRLHPLHNVRMVPRFP